MQESLNRPLLVLIALIQGLILFALSETIDRELWPHNVRVIEMLLWATTLSVPVLLLLSLNQENVRRVLIGAGIFTLVVAGVAAYTGWQMEPDDKIPDDPILPIFCLTLAILLFKVVMYLQIWAGRQSFTYARLFQYSWRNAILGGLCLLFVLVFWGILILWGQLFDVVGISLFKELFSERWFMFPALALANGLAFNIFRNLDNIVDTMSRVMQALCQFLLPLLVFISLLFLICLPFVGISALWDTGRGTALVLWLQALTLFFFNATFQDESHPSPYWQALQKFIYVGILVLPIYSLIAAYGIWLRIDQYGFTVARLWAVVVVGILAMFAFAYSINLVWLRERAAAKFGWINVRMGLVVMALMMLVNSPMLDFRKISVSSQLAALESGKTSAEEFDIRYFAHGLGRPGYLALEALKQTQDEAFVDRIANAYRSYPFETVPLTTVEAEAVIRTYPDNLIVPESLHAAIVEQIASNASASAAYILNPDLNDDGAGEWILIETTYGNYSQAYVMKESVAEEGGWTREYVSVWGDSTGPVDQWLADGQVSIEEPTWKVLRIGEMTIRVPDNYGLNE